MPNILKLLRSITPGARPTGRTYGEAYVNLADKQFGVFDNSNAPQDLIGVPFFSPSIPYPAGAAVNYQGVFYVATTAVAAGGFNPAQWAQIQPAGGFSTGDAKLTLKNVADPTWILMDDGTIGDATSGATTRANADCQALFTLMWNNILDTWAPVTGGRGASASADWTAHKPIKLTRQLGRSLIIGGTGAGLTARPLGGYLGEERHTQTGGELAAHAHSANTPNYYTIYTSSYPVDAGGAQNVYTYYSYANTVTIQNAGSSTPFNVMQPSAAWNIMLKL
jgi:hypothetical protein